MVTTDPFGLRRPYLSAPELAARAGVDVELARRLWRALGLPAVEDDEVAFDDDDVAALAALRRVIALGIPEDELVTMARVYGEALARIADAHTRVFKRHVLDPHGDADTQRVDQLVPELLDAGEVALRNALRRHQSVAMQRLLVRPEAGDEACAGFVDLVDFSRIAEDLSGVDLSELVSRFEDVAIEVCADRDVRLVKVLGDAAMLVSPDAAAAVAAAVEIVRRVGDDRVLPDARAGLDRGPLVALGGDYFGHAVNVAARATAFARPGTVVVSRAVLDAVPGLDVGRIGPQRLKGVGRVELFKVRPGEGAGS